MEYAEKLKDPRWQKKRLKVFERANWGCEACRGETETLHVHHLIYSKGEPWDAPDDTLECLCETCHEFREYMNEFFDGRSLTPTWVCASLFHLIKPAFDGTSQFESGMRFIPFLQQLVDERKRRIKPDEASMKEETTPCTTTVPPPSPPIPSS